MYPKSIALTFRLTKMVTASAFASSCSYMYCSGLMKSSQEELAFVTEALRSDTITIHTLYTIYMAFLSSYMHGHIWNELAE